MEKAVKTCFQNSIKGISGGWLSRKDSRVRVSKQYFHFIPFSGAGDNPLGTRPRVPSPRCRSSLLIWGWLALIRNA